MFAGEAELRQVLQEAITLRGKVSVSRLKDLSVEKLNQEEMVRFFRCVRDTMRTLEERTTFWSLAPYAIYYVL